MLKNQTTKATVMAFTAYFLWGFSFLFSRLGLNAAQPFVLLAHRFTLAAAVMLILILTGAQKVRLRGKRVWLLLMMGFTEPVLYFVGEAYGILYTTTAFSGVMIAMIPIFTLLASGIFLREKASRGQAIWSAVSIAGVVVIALQGSGNGTVTLKGVAFLLIAVVSSVAFTILSRRLSGEFSAFERTFIPVLEGAAAYWVLGAVQCRADLTQLIAPLASGQYWLCIGFLACCASVICYTLLNQAFSYVPVNRITIGTNLVTVVSIFAGVIFLKESFSWVSILCSAVILAGIYGVQRAPAAAETASHE